MEDMRRPRDILVLPSFRPAQKGLLNDAFGLDYLEMGRAGESGTWPVNHSCKYWRPKTGSQGLFNPTRLVQVRCSPRASN